MVRLTITASLLVSSLAFAATPAAPATPATPASPSMAPKAAAPAAGAAPAEAAKAHEMPPPPAELDGWKPFEGTWKCKGNLLATPMAPGHATEATLKIKRDLAGYWINAAYAGKKTKVDPKPFLGQDFLTYDGMAKTWNRVMVDSYGGWATMTSTGWDGDKLVWTGDSMMPGHKMAVRHTIVKKGPKEITTTWEMSMDKKTFTAFVEETCKK